MSRRRIDVNTVDEAIARINTPHEGDQIVVRALPLTVPNPSFDMAITNASMQLLMDSFNNDPNVANKYKLNMCQSGQYEVVAVFHIRRIDGYTPPILN